MRATRRNRSGPRGASRREPLSAAHSTERWRERRSARGLRAPSLSRSAELAAILDAAYGVTAAATAETPPLRAVPSAGALYPARALRPLLPRRKRCPGASITSTRSNERSGSSRSTQIASTALRSRRSRRSSTTPRPSSSISGVFWRSRFKYGLRGYRFVLLEAGHAAQNLLLAATALGLASVPVGGFYDRELERLLQVDGVNESALYALSLGRPA